MFRFADGRIDEASGIGVGIASPGVVYVQNDSGDSARFFAVDASTGATLAVYWVPGAQNVDWEDLAVARDARGVPSVWLADIGDNDAVRQEVRIYRVDEPVVDRGRVGVDLTTAEPSVWRLRYPDGPADAEALAVAPGGTGYVVTKSFVGESAVYAVPATADPARVQTLHRVAAIRFSMTGTPGGPLAAIGQLTVTGAAMSTDGRVLVVRTYTDAYLWRVSSGDIAAALHGSPVRLALPEQRQGEGVAVLGSTLLVDSEGVGSTVYAVPTPPLPTRSGPPAPTPVASEPSAVRNATGTTAQESTTAGRGPWLWFGLAGLALAGAGLAVSLRRRSR